MNHLYAYHLYENANKATKVITTTLGLSEEVASFCVSLNPKIAIWYANEYKKLMAMTNDATARRRLTEEAPKINAFVATANKPPINLKEEAFTAILDKVRKLDYINDWISNPGVTLAPAMLRTMSWNDAFNGAREWHNDLKASGVIKNETGKVLYTYPNGYYWIDLQKKSCGDEADAMGHCGNSRLGTLISLRSKNKEPHVTIDASPDYKHIAQCKGKGNSVPDEKYDKYIVDYIIQSDVETIEYDQECDFNPTKDAVFHTLYVNTKLFFMPDSMKSSFTNIINTIEDAGISAYAHKDDDDEVSFFLNRVNPHYETEDRDLYCLVEQNDCDLINKNKPANVPYDLWLVFWLMHVRHYAMKMNIHEQMLDYIHNFSSSKEGLLTMMGEYSNSGIISKSWQDIEIN